MPKGLAERPRRRYRRRTLRVLVEYVCENGLSTEPATTLGAGGLFIEGETEIEGRVVWRRRAGDPGHHSPGMGIEFTDRAGAARLARELETLD
jgi:hypothetical protein